MHDGTGRRFTYVAEIDGRTRLGSVMSPECGRCGSKVPIGANYCPECGQPVGRTEGGGRNWVALNVETGDQSVPIVPWMTNDFHVGALVVQPE